MSHVDWNVLRGQAFRLLDALDWEGSPNNASFLKGHLTKVLVLTKWRRVAIMENDAAALAYFNRMLSSTYLTNPRVTFDWTVGFKLDGHAVEDYNVSLDDAVGLIREINGGEDWVRTVGPIVNEWDRFKNDYNAKVAAGTTPHALPPKPHTTKRSKLK